jgi:hypothetical protein
VGPVDAGVTVGESHQNRGRDRDRTTVIKEHEPADRTTVIKKDDDDGTRTKTIIQRPRLKTMAPLKPGSRGLRCERRCGRDFLGDDGEFGQLHSPKTGRDRDIRGIAAARHYDAADSRVVVSRIEGEPPFA